MASGRVVTFPGALNRLLKSPTSNVAKELGKFGVQVESRAKINAKRPARSKRANRTAARVDRVAHRRRVGRSSCTSVSVRTTASSWSAATRTRAAASFTTHS